MPPTWQKTITNFDNMKYSLFSLLLTGLMFGCVTDESTSDYDDDPREDAKEELSDFGELMQEKFEEKELPYSCNNNFDNYEAKEFLTEEEFRLLELYMVFPEGYQRKRYASEDRILLESGVTLAVVTSLDNEQELSTYLVTYNDQEWYVDNVRIAYDEVAEGFLRIYSEINENDITRTTAVYLDEGEMIEEEHYFIQKDGNVVWEDDLIGDDI